MPPPAPTRSLVCGDVFLLSMYLTLTRNCCFKGRVNSFSPPETHMLSPAYQRSPSFQARPPPASSHFLLSQNAMSAVGCLKTAKFYAFVSYSDSS